MATRITPLYKYVTSKNPNYVCSGCFKFHAIPIIPAFSINNTNLGTDVQVSPQINSHKWELGAERYVYFHFLCKLTDCLSKISKQNIYFH